MSDSEDREVRSRSEDQSRPTDDRGGSRDDRGGSRDDRGGSRDDRGGSRDDRGGSRDDRGGSRGGYRGGDRDDDDRSRGGGRDDRRRRYRSFFRKKVCRFCVGKAHVDYLDASALRRFTTERGKILPARMTGTCAKHQRILSLAIKRARALAMLPFVAK